MASPTKSDRVLLGALIFRSKDGERRFVASDVDTSGAPRLALRDIYSLRSPANPLLTAIRRQQIDVIVRTVPVTVFVHALASVLLVAALWGEVPPPALLTWTGVGIAICFWRAGRAIRMRRDESYLRRNPVTFARLTRTVTGLALLWIVPIVLWFDGASFEAQLYLTILMAVLLSTGNIVFGTVPPAALGYIVVMWLGFISIAAKFDNIPMFVMGTIYAGALAWALTDSARRFILHARTRFELEERGEIIGLLREFEAAGSGGMWELDADLRLTHISNELSSVLGYYNDQLHGLTLRELLDPNERIVHLSSGMRTLFMALDKGESFKDVAIPTHDNSRWFSVSGKPLVDTAGEVVGWRGVGSDITDLRLHGEDAVRAARTDPLTGVANRLLMRELLEEAMLRQVDGRNDCALVLVDLDRFKLVNDTLGHAIGDQLLCEVAQRLEKTIDDGGTVGRLGGDEFAIIWTGGSDRSTLARLSLEIIADLSRTMRIGAADIHVGASVGIAVAPTDGAREEALMRSADLALYRAKGSGRGSYSFYDHSMFEEAEDLRLLENDVRQALAQNDLSLAYQPIVDAVSGGLVGREALLRWNHPLRGAISPDTFIPIIEDAGLIHRIGDWVIREACKQAIEWPENERVAVNVSAAQLSGSGLAKTVVSALAASGLRPNRLELEVTESIFLGDDAETLASLERLRAIGVRLVIDDFGKGYSSFGYLARAQFAKIKIDSMFSHGAADGDANCTAIVRAILALADGLGVETTAEGVETEEQARAMRGLGVDQLQGFLFGRPEFPNADKVIAIAEKRTA